MKKTTTSLAMAMLCPYQKVKRPMSRGAKLIILSIILSFAKGPAIAQTQSQDQKQTQQATYALKGKVTDTQNNPLSGATITETLTKQTAQTDAEGNFSLPVPNQNGQIIVTYLGYLSKTLIYNTTKPTNIQLTEDRSQLQAVEINTGYYSVKQKNLTGSISSVKAEQIQKQPISNPLLALAGNTTGVYVQQVSGTPGSAVNLLIRGQNSIAAGTHPLYLVDGIPFNSSPLSASTSASTAAFGSGGTSPFATLSPDDISSIDILKDADATAIYGTRGANGVVLITTKNGKNGKTKINLNSYLGYSDLARQLPMMDNQQFAALRSSALALDGMSAPRTTDYDINGTWDKNRNTNWQTELLGGKAALSNHNLSVSGGSPTTQFYLSGSHQRQGTITAGDQQYARSSAHLSGSLSNEEQTFTASASVSYSADNSNWANTDLVARAISLQPNAPEIFTSTGSLNWEKSTWVNPLRIFENRYKGKNSTLTASTQLRYAPIKALELSARLGYSASALNDKSYIPVSYYDPAQNITPASSVTEFNQSEIKGYSLEPQASYQTGGKFGKFNFLAGLSLQSSQRTQLLLRGLGFSSDALIENMQAATTQSVRGSSITDYRYFGTYARIGYVLHDRYILNLTARRDGSSRFGPGKRFSSFGALGAAYLLSETHLVKNQLPFFSLLKLRGSYGTSGNDQIGDYEYLDTYQAVNGYNGVSGLSPTRLFNPDFAWETSRKLELAMDFGLFKDRIRGSIGWYRNRSSNQLISYPLAATTGFTSMRNNLNAVVQNTGIEAELSGTVTKGKLQWESALNLTVPRNKLLAFPGLENSSYANQYVIGKPLSITKVYELLGVDPATGVYSFRDFDHDGVVSSPNDRGKIQDRGIRAYGGLTNSFRYGNLELSVLVQFVLQNASSFRSLLSFAPGRTNNQPAADVGKYWNAPGDIAQLQRPTSGNHAAAIAAFNLYPSSDAAIADASFARVKNLALSYHSTKLLKAKTVRLYLQGQNLFTFTDYFGLDPESPSLITPPLRTLTLGLQLTL